MKKMILLAVFVFVGCVSMQTELGIDEKEWLKETMKEELTFTVSADSIESAWSRGVKFINQYCDTKLQVVSDYHIETYNANKGAFTLQYGYSITRVKLGNSYEVSVSGHSNNDFTEGWLDENLHIMARYMRTGNLKYPKLIDGRGNHLHVNSMRNQYKE